MKMLRGRVRERIQKRYIQATLVCVVFAAVFISLRTQQYLAVDGAIRCLAVYHRPELFFNESNHLLSSVNVFLFHRLLSILGLRAAGPLDFINLTQIMNCLAAAGCVAMLYWLMHLATLSVGISLGVATGYGFSRAFLLHATNSAEPMVGLFWSFLAVVFVVLSIQKSRGWLLFVSGVLMALAMATYQSMVLIGPVLALLCLKTSPAVEPSSKVRLRLCALFYFVAGAFLGVCVIYGSAYSYKGENSITGMLARFFTLQGESVYGGLKLSKLINLPFGLIGNLFPVLPPGYSGVRSLFASKDMILWIPWLILVMFCVVAFFTLSVLQTRKACEKLEEWGKYIILCGFLGISFTLTAPLYWDPIYDKLWLQPLACIFFLLGFLVKINSHAKPQAFLRRTALILTAAIVISNLTWAVPSHFHETEFLREAQQVDQFIKSSDLLISDWDAISVLHKSIWKKADTIDLPSSASKHRDDVMLRINQAVQEANKRGGQVYFLGVLDQTEQSWNAFLGERVGLPYQAFSTYRDHARVVATFPYRSSQVTLRRLEIPLKPNEKT